jgi:hypothetical protein
VSPIGLVGVGIGAAAVGIALYQKSVYDATAETRNLKNSTAELREEVSRDIESINARRQATDEQVASGLRELDYNQSLLDELKLITDENGHVKEGYEDRANYITGELAKATGIEIENNNGVISSYKEIQNQIQETINKKKVEVILAGQEEKMAEAIDKRDAKTKELLDTEKQLASAQSDLTQKEKELEQAQKDLDYAMAYGTGSQPFEAQAKYDAALQNVNNQKDAINNLQDTYNSLNDAVKNYSNDIANYEEMNKLYAEGSAESIQKIIELNGKTIESNGKTVELSYAEQIRIQQKYAKQSKEEYEKAKTSHNEFEMSKSRTTNQEAINRLTTLGNELKKMTSVTGENSEDIKEGWRQLAAGSKDVYNSILAEMPIEERQMIEQMTGVIAEKTPEAVAQTNSSMNDILWAFDKDKEFRTEALSNLTSFLNGLSDEELRGLLEQAGVQDADKVMQGIREGNLGENEGRSILQSLKAGLEDNSITNKLFSTVRGLSNRLSQMFKITPTVTVGPNQQSSIQKLPGFAERTIIRALRRFRS